MPVQACQAAAAEEEEEEKSWKVSACVGFGCLRTARASSGTVGDPTTAAAFVLGPWITSDSSCSSCLHWFAGHGRLRPCAVVYLFVARPLHTMLCAIVLGDTVSSAGRHRKVLLMKRVR
jgi:hypothetical protein